MKISYLSQSSLPSTAANSVHVMKMCQAMKRAGHEVTLYAFRGEGEWTTIFDLYDIKTSFPIISWRVYLIPGRSIVLAGLTFCHILFMSRPRPDLLYARGLFSLFFCSILKIPFIYEAHAAPRTKIHKIIEKYLFSKGTFKKLICISKALSDYYLCDKNNLCVDNTIVAHDGADLIQRMDHSTNLSQKGDRRNAQIGYAGGLYVGKGIDLIVQVAARLPECNFHIIGGDKYQIDEFNLSHDMPSNIYFYGHVPHAEVIGYLATMNILLAPYQKKVLGAAGNMDIANWMSPLKIFEYMSVGKPIICSKIPVLSEILVNDINCIMCEADDVHEWVEAIKRLISDSKFSTKLANQAKNDLVEKYTWDKRVELILNKTA